MVALADIVQRYGAAYRAKYGERLLPSHRKVLRNVARCRTPALGGHVYTCETCDETHYRYHSCRDRHCPQCQHAKGQRWLIKQQALLPATHYFMLTFTLPQELRRVVRSHQRLCYQVLFRTSAAAAQTLAQESRFVGGRLGMVGVLHTWGRNLSYHPHVHYVVPGGGLTADGVWQPARKNFLLPVKALSQVFRAKFRDALRQQAPELFAEIPAAVWEKAWVVHSQPVGRGLRALKYLAPYIFRVAISNRRIERLKNGKVLFRYRKSDTGTFRTCRLPAEEFLRRFLQHVLPKGFVKVRYYGFLAPGCRPLLAGLHQQLGSLATEQPAAAAGANAVEPATEPNAPAQPEVRCPTCGRPMQCRALPPAKPRPRGRCPPPI